MDSQGTEIANTSATLLPSVRDAKNIPTTEIAEDTAGASATESVEDTSAAKTVEDTSVARAVEDATAASTVEDASVAGTTEGTPAANTVEDTTSTPTAKRVKGVTNTTKKATNPSAAKSVKDTTDYAFNTAGTAYDYRIPGRQQSLRISIRGISSSILGADSNMVAPSTKPTPEELDDTQGSEQVMWVGMMPMSSGTENTGPPAKRQRGLRPLRRTRAKGFSITSNDNFDIIPYDEKALRIVVRCKGSVAKFYVLAEQVRGLCKGFTCPQDEVFYFTEFRDDSATSVEERRRKWNEIIRKAIDVSPRNEVKNLNITKIDVPWKLSFANEIQSLMCNYMIQPEAWILDAMLDLLKVVDHDLTYRPSIKNVGLHKLVSIRKEFDAEDASNVVQECLILWPELKQLGLRKDSVIKLASGLRQGQIVLEYRLIRGVLVDWHRRCRETNIGFENLPELVRSTRNHVLLQIGDIIPPNNSIDRDTFTTFIRCQANHLRDMSTYSKRHTQALKDSQGNHAIASDLPSIWASFKNLPDVDSTRLYAVSAHQYDVAQTSAKDRAIEEKLDQHIELLDRMERSIISSNQDE